MPTAPTGSATTPLRQWHFAVHAQNPAAGIASVLNRCVVEFLRVCLPADLAPEKTFAVTATPHETRRSDTFKVLLSPSQLLGVVAKLGNVVSILYEISR